MRACFPTKSNKSWIDEGLILLKLGKVKKNQLVLPDRFLPRVNFFYLFHPLEEVRILKAKEGVVLFVECQVWHIPMNLLKKIRLSPRVQILYFQVYMYVMY